MLRQLTISMALTLLSATALGQETTPTPPAAPETAPAEASAPPAEAAGPLPADTVPGLHIVWDCGECTVNDKVIPLVIGAYRLEAAKRKKTVSETHVIHARINDFRQRPPGVRVAVGIFAGKDRLALMLKVNDQEYEVKDYSANAMQGMNHLCESVGQRAFKQVASLIK
jgi:hypothetical protein